MGHEQYPSSTAIDAADFVLLLLVTGVRFEEALTLQWKHIDANSETYKLIDTKNHRTHTLPLTRTTKQLFERRRERANGSEWVFPSPLDASKHASASKWLTQVTRESGIKFTHHDVRRTFATVAGELGIDTVAIAKALNQKSNGVTSGYIQTTTDSLHRIFESVENAILYYEDQ